MPVRRLLLAAILLLATVPGSLCAEQMSFDLPSPHHERNLLVPDIDRTAGQSFNDPWPWGGIEISIYSGLYPVFFAASQGIDVGIPALPWVSVVLKAEATAGLLLTGGIFDLGFRTHFELSKTVAVYGEVTGRWGVGELTIAEIFEDFFKEVVDAGVDSINGFGVGFAGGIELGGRYLRFFAGLHYSAIFVDTGAFVDDYRFNLPTITINHFGFQAGMRVYLG